jgi:hypothetical protein
MHLGRRDRLVVKGAFALFAIVAATVVLWARQTPDALLRVHSFAGGLAQVTFWALPTIALYLVVERASSVIILVEGCLLVGLLVGGWWLYSTDSHSTASIGPAVGGWIVGPGIVIGVFMCKSLAPRKPRP